MSWIIEDTNEHEITITDGLREWIVPKFAIKMVTEGDYVHLYWYDGQGGSGRYYLQLDYNEVDCGAYTDIEDCPASAADLEAMINAMIVSGFDGGDTPGGGGHSVAEFIDLLTTANLESQWVEAFDSNTKQGGGYFQFINESNLSIPLIAGYQIKTSLSATGYWRRIDPLNQWNPVWCGALNEAAPGTLASYGWSQGDADIMWGSGLVDVNDHGYDDAALRYSFDLLNTFDSVAVNLEPKYYYTNDTVWIPKYFEFLRVYGNFAWIDPTGEGYDVIARPEADDLADAQVMLNCRFYFECLNINIPDGYTGLKPGPSTSCAAWMVDTYNGIQGVDLEFCLNFFFLECVNKLSTNGFLVRNDGCVDCDGDNSNSNMSTFSHCRAYNEDGAGGKAFAMYGVSGGRMETCTVEGHFYANPIYIDGQNAGTIKGFEINNCHYECVDTSTDSTNEAFVWVRLAGGNVVVKNAIGHYPMIMVNSGGTTGNLHVEIKNINGWAPYTGNYWFYNAGNSSHDYINIPDLGGDPSIIAALILGTPMFDWSTAGPGNNRFRLLASPYLAELPASSGVQSVSDDGDGVVIVDNTDPVNPVVGFGGINIGAGLSGDGTSGSPLAATGPTVAQTFANIASGVNSYGFILEAEYVNNPSGAVPDGDFYAQLGGAGSTVGGFPSTGVAAVINRPGIIRFNTGTTGTGYASTGTQNLKLVLGGGQAVYESSIYIPVLPTSADKAVCFSRLTNTFTNITPTLGVEIFYDLFGDKTGSSASANWQWMTTNTPNRTAGVSSVAVAAATWYRLTFVVNAAATSVDFYVDGVLIGTSAAHIPNGTGSVMGLQTGLIKTNYTATAREVYCDYTKFYQIFTTPR